MRHVVVDANVFLSLLTDRNEKQRAAAKALLLAAEDGEVVAVLPQFVIFEIAHVLRNLYGVAAPAAASSIRDAIALPGVLVVDDCPWKRVLDSWAEAFPSIADAAIVAVAVESRYDSVATFDRKLKNRMITLGVRSYW